uniref:Protein kinase domain-containing protein n=1 Tax=Panagrellus redivivus TaxID=6233 RepID=A0A7E4VM24_PANRE
MGTDEKAPDPAAGDAPKDNNPLAPPAIKAIKADKTGHFANLIRQIFHCPTEWPQPSLKPGRWKMLRPQQEIDESLMVGDFLHVPENATYRILGMKVRRQGGANSAIEYDVARLPKDVVQMRGFVSEPVVRDCGDYVMRMCTSEDADVQKRFMHTYEVFHTVHRTYPSSEVRGHFPAIFGAGAFEKLFYKQHAEDFSSRFHCVHFLTRPRPYFIRERIGLTFEELLNNSYYGFLDIPTARYLTVGVIRALKAVHGLELVHRCVSSSTFALRSHPGGFVPDGELSNQVVCTDVSFACIFRQQGHKPRPYVRRFAGTYKYSSPNAMKCRSQYPADDIVSAIYLFVELIHGRLAWRGIVDREAIIASKEVFHVNPTILVDNLDPEYRIPIDIRDLSLIFKMLRDSNPFKGRLNYTYVCEILHRIAEANKQPDWVSYLELERVKDVDALFSKALRAFRPPLETKSQMAKKKKSKSKSKSKKRKHRKHDKNRKTTTQSHESKGSKETDEADRSSTNLSSTQMETNGEEKDPKKKTQTMSKEQNKPKDTPPPPPPPPKKTASKENPKKSKETPVPPSKKSEKPIPSKVSKKVVPSKKEATTTKNDPVKPQKSKEKTKTKSKEKLKSQKTEAVGIGKTKTKMDSVKEKPKSKSEEEKDKSVMPETQMEEAKSKFENLQNDQKSVMKTQMDVTAHRTESKQKSVDHTQDDDEQ